MRNKRSRAGSAQAGSANITRRRRQTMDKSSPATPSQPVTSSLAAPAAATGLEPLFAMQARQADALCVLASAAAEWLQTFARQQADLLRSMQTISAEALTDLGRLKTPQEVSARLTELTQRMTEQSLRHASDVSELAGRTGTKTCSAILNATVAKPRER
jgi:hypothetical protein